MEKRTRNMGQQEPQVKEKWGKNKPHTPEQQINPSAGLPLISDCD